MDLVNPDASALDRSGSTSPNQLLQGQREGFKRAGRSRSPPSTSAPLYPRGEYLGQVPSRYALQRPQNRASPTPKPRKPGFLRKAERQFSAAFRKSDRSSAPFSRHSPGSVASRSTSPDSRSRPQTPNRVRNVAEQAPRSGSGGAVPRSTSSYSQPSTPTPSQGRNFTRRQPGPLLARQPYHTRNKPRFQIPIHRDLEGSYFTSLTSNRFETPGTFQTSEDSSVPSFLLEDNQPVWPQSQERESIEEQGLSRLQGSENFAPAAADREPEGRERRIGHFLAQVLHNKDRVRKICSSLPDGQLSSETAEGIGREQTYLALSGKRPEESLCQIWRREVRVHSPTREVCEPYHNSSNSSVLGEKPSTTPGGEAVVRKQRQTLEAEEEIDEIISAQKIESLKTLEDETALSASTKETEELKIKPYIFAKPQWKKKTREHPNECSSAQLSGEEFPNEIISDLPPLNPKKLVKGPEEVFEQLPSLCQTQSSSQGFVHLETGEITVGDPPVTPENKFRGSHHQQLQLDTCYTASVYPLSVSLYPSPLVIKKTPPNFLHKALSATPTSHIESSLEQVDPFYTTKALLDSYLSASDYPPSMETLQVSSALRSSTKTKAEEDARAMQKSVIDSCKKAGRDPPKYVLMELIGKGSFGRVYKGKDINTTKIVAVKIIDVDESDTLNPRMANTYSEFMKEVNALKILSESKAKNINHVIEALPVGKAMWMITEYCGGGSVATLMKPTPTGLKEMFIIPILREVAEAVKWVHQAGIIHRDLKCANILITEEGGVQLCDFGVAGIIETSLDKRSTFIGTFNWMAPELFQGSQYGKEVDIWAFGSMAYEMATGLPPNVASGVTGMDLGPHLKNHIPRLVGGAYSDGLKNIVAYCLEYKPSDRPSIEAVQKHHYVCNTNAKYPASGLSDLVKAFKKWESHGGTRKSLFGAGGAQGPSELSPTPLGDDSWNFSTTAAFDQAVARDMDTQDVINVYGAAVALDTDFQGDTSRPVRQQQSRPSRRRPPPEALAPLRAPLEKLFDPNTISNYEDNARTHYNQRYNNASDLPLRDNSAQISIRDTLIDLDALHDMPSGLSSFSDMETMKPTRRNYLFDSEEERESGGHNDFSRPALSDPADNPNRRTQDWKFPVLAPPASAHPEVSHFPALSRPNVTAASSTRLAYGYREMEFPMQSSNNFIPSAQSSPSRDSLIDLDLSVPEPSRPSTADSAASQDLSSANPFHWERHASMNNDRSGREPSLYLPEDSSLQPGDLYDRQPQYEGYTAGHAPHVEPRFDDSSSAAIMAADFEMSNPSRDAWVAMGPGPAIRYTMDHFPPLPPPPSVAALSGTAGHGEMRNELDRMFDGLGTQLEAFRDVYQVMPRRSGELRDRITSVDGE